MKLKIFTALTIGAILVAAYIYSLERNAEHSVTVRDGFFGISGILHNKSLLDEAGVECHIYGFFIGASESFWDGGLRLNTKNILYTVRNGSTPIVTFLAGEIVDPDKARENVRRVVEYYTEGEGFRLTGYRVIYWQIGNEENGFWRTSCSAEEYAEKVKIIAGAVKEACPDCTIIMGGLLPGISGEKNLSLYLKTFLECGGGEYIDVYNFHYYGFSKPVPGGDYYLSGVKIYREIKRILALYGYDKPVWVTETSTFSGKVGQIYQSEEEQAADLVKRFVVLKAVGVEKAFWTYMVEPSYEGTGEGFFDQAGLIYDGLGPYDKGCGVRKKSYYAYKTIVHLLRDSSIVQAYNNTETYVFQFASAGQMVTVVWHDYWHGNATVKIKPRGEVKIIDIYGNTLMESTANLTWTLGLEPIYIVGEVEVEIGPWRISPPGGFLLACAFRIASACYEMLSSLATSSKPISFIFS